MSQTIITEYPAPSRAPAAVRRWERLIDAAATYEEAEIQMLYVVAVEARRLRVAAQIALIGLAVLFILGIVLGARLLP